MARNLVFSSLLVVIAILSPVARAEDAPAKPKVPVPAYAPQASKLAEIRQLFKEDYARRTPAARKALAEKLFKEATATTDDVVAQYVLFRESADMAIERGDVPQTIASIDGLCKEFLVDVLQVKTDALTRLRATATSDGFQPLVYAASELAGRAASLDLYEQATSLAELAVTTAGRAHDSDLLAEGRACQVEVRMGKAEFDATRPAAAALAQRPDDPQANTVMGRYTCLVRGDWAGGLPLLAKSAEPALSAIARLELAQPTEVPAQVALGDAWLKVSENKELSKVYRQGARQRAGGWYEQALPNAAGLTVKNIEGKLKAIDAAGGVRPSRVVNLMPLIDPAKDVVAGTWALADGTLKCGPSPAARIRIPYHPPGEYDYLIEFEQPTVNNTIVQVLTTGKSQFTFAVAVNNKSAGFSVNANSDPKKAGFEVPKMMSPAVKYRCLVKVRRDRVTAYLDDTPVCLVANPDDLAMVKAWDVNSDQALGLGTWDCETIFSKIEVREIGGRGKLLR